MGEDTILASYAGHIALASLIVGLIAVGITLWRHRISDLKEELADPAVRDRLLAEQGSRWATAYQRGLVRMTRWADDFYGPNPSFKALGRCLQIAFLYPVFAAILTWGIANAHSPGGFQVFADTPNGFTSFLSIAFFLHGALFFYRFSRTEERLEQRVRAFTHWVFPNSPKILRLLSPILVNGANVLAVSYAFFAIAVGSYALVGFSTTAPNAIIYTYFAAAAFPAALSRVDSVATHCWIVVAFAYMVAALEYNFGQVEAFTVPIFFFVALPICNAVTDFLSISATRDFLKWARHGDRSICQITVIVFADLIIGAMCLLVLMVLLTQGLDLWDKLSPETLPLDWRDYWTTAFADPLQGIALGFMAFTTILPTLVHALFGLSAVLTNESRMRARALEHLDKTKNILEDADRTAIAKGLAGATLYGWLLATTLVIAFATLLWPLTKAFLHWGVVEGLLAWLFPLTPH